MLIVTIITATYVTADGSPFPEPTGTYKVGVTSRHLIDTTRKETYPSAPKGSQRELMVYFWYPADVKADAVPAAYIPDTKVQLDMMIKIGQGWGFDVGPIADKIKDYVSHAYTDAPLAAADASYPVLIFSHLWAGIPQSYSIQLEELASHGYIIAAINHTYASAASVFPDGKTATFDFTVDANTSEPIWVQDQIFVMNELEKMNVSDATFAGKLDLTKLGMFGHSLGAVAASSTCVLDQRCKAFVDEDGGFTDTSLQGFKVPYLYMLGMGNADDLKQLEKIYAHISTNAYYFLRFSGFEHGNFADAPLWEKNNFALGSVDRLRSVEIVRTYVLDFFDHYLKGMKEPLMDGLSTDYPEVQGIIQVD
jgi:hypothetical protein